MKYMGFQTDAAKDAQEKMAMALNLGILALGIYRGAQLASAAASLIRAHAEALASIMSSPWFLIPVAAGIAIAAWGAISALSAPNAQMGGVVMPQSGGTLVRVAEAGEPEVIAPLSRAREMGFGGGGQVNVTMNVYSDDPREISRQLGREIQKTKLAGA